MDIFWIALKGFIQYFAVIAGVGSVLWAFGKWVRSRRSKLAILLDDLNVKVTHLIEEQQNHHRITLEFANGERTARMNFQEHLTVRMEELTERVGDIAVQVSEHTGILKGMER